MSLPDSYTLKIGVIPAYFDAIQGAEAPDRFSMRFLANLDFASSNDRVLIGILKDLGFLNTDGVPQERYYQYLDKTQSDQVLAEGIQESYEDLFAVNKEAHSTNYAHSTREGRKILLLGTSQKHSLLCAK